MSAPKPATLDLTLSKSSPELPETLQEALPEARHSGTTGDKTEVKVGTAETDTETGTELGAETGTETGMRSFVRAQAAWEDRHGALKAERERWFRIAMVLGGVSVITTALAVWAAVRAEYIPHIVAVDEFGQSVSVIAPRAITDWPDEAVRREISDFIRDWRSISTDPEVMRGRLRRIQFFLDENSAADRKIVAWARAPRTNPFKRSESVTVDLEMHNVNSLGGSSWIAEWTETTRNRSNGIVILSERYKGTISLGKRRISDQMMLLRNPFGMLIEDIDVVRLSQ